MTENEKEFITAYRRLPEREQIKIIGLIEQRLEYIEEEKAKRKNDKIISFSSLKR